MGLKIHQQGRYGYFLQSLHQLINHFQEAGSLKFKEAREEGDLLGPFLQTPWKPAGGRQDRC